MAETFALARDVTATEVEHGMVLLDQRRGRYWQLNGTGAAMVRLLLAGEPPDAVAERLAAAGAGERVRSDVRSLIAALRQAKLVAR